MSEEYEDKYYKWMNGDNINNKMYNFKNTIIEETDEDKLDKIDIRVIESYVRKKKLKNLKK